MESKALGDHLSMEEPNLASPCMLNATLKIQYTAQQAANVTEKAVALT